MLAIFTFYMYVFTEGGDFNLIKQGNYKRIKDIRLNNKSSPRIRSGMHKQTSRITFSQAATSSKLTW
jgi:hypothetical protein